MRRGMIDEAIGELEKARTDRENEEREVIRLKKENERLAKENNELEKKKTNIASYIKQREDELSVSLKEKEKKADELLKKASLQESEARATLDNAKKRESEAEKLKTNLQTQLDSARAFGEANSKITHELKDIVKIVNEKLGKL